MASVKCSLKSRVFRHFAARFPDKPRKHAAKLSVSTIFVNEVCRIKMYTSVYTYKPLPPVTFDTPNGGFLPEIQVLCARLLNTITR